MSRIDPKDPANRDAALVKRTLRKVEFLYDHYFRCETEGVENVPASEPALLFGNHCGSTWTIEAPLLTAAILRAHGADHPLYYLSHPAFFGVPWLGRWMAQRGAVVADAETAARVVAAGGQLITFPGGELDSHKPFVDRHKVNFFGHKGFIRFSVRERVPLVPFVHVGTHETLIVLSRGERLAHWLRLDRWLQLHVCPISLSFPLGLTVGPYFPMIPLPAKVRIRVLRARRLWEEGFTDPNDEVQMNKALEMFTQELQAELDELADGRRFLIG